MKLASIKKDTKRDIKLSLCWIKLFSLIVSIYIIWTQLKVIKVLERRLDLAQTNMERITEKKGK